MVAVSIVCVAAAAVLGLLLFRARRRLAEMEQRVQTREDQFAVLAHEIKTPLALIQASTELLASQSSGPLTDGQESFLSEIDEAAQRIELLADNVLTESRLQVGVFQPIFASLDVRETVRVVASGMRRLADRRGQRVSLEYPQLMGRTWGDATLIRQAVTNLVQNAIRHTSDGGTVTVSAFDTSTEVVVSVWDDGAGMTPAERKRAFDRFVSHTGGSGLGLTIVKTIADLHGGSVKVDTSLGRGAAFLLILPRMSDE